MANPSNIDALNDYVNSLDSVQKIKTINIKLPKGQKDYEYLIISDLNLGAKTNRPAMKKLIKQINYVKDNPNVMVVLGGNLVAFSRKIEETKYFTQVLAGALEPIKHKIVLAYYGFEENRYLTLRQPLRTLSMLLSELKISSKCLAPTNTATINVTVNNESTNNKDFIIRDYFSAIKSSAITYSAEGRNGFNSVGNPGLYDNIFITCSNNSGVFRKAIMRPSSSGNNDQIEKHSFNVILDSGYKLMFRTPSHKVVRYNYTDKYTYKITPGINEDAKRIVGKGTLNEEKYKAFVSRHPIGVQKINQSSKELTAQYLNAKKLNEFKAKWLMSMIDKKLQTVSNENLQNLVKTKNKLEMEQKDIDGREK